MATNYEKCAKRVNADFSQRLAAAFSLKFARELETSLDISSMQLVSRAVDGGPFTESQRDWIATWSDGYGEALGVVRSMAWPHRAAA